MATVMEVMAKLTGDASGMIGAFKKAGSESETQTTKIKRDWKSAQDSLNSLALPATAIVAGGALIAKKLGDMASVAEQNVGATEAVFKQYAKTVKTQSAGAAKAVGLSASEYQQFAVVVGSQLKNLGIPMEEVAGGTQGLIQKGADLASMFGGPTSDAISAISALLRGESDPIERYGVSLKITDVNARMAAEGLDTLTGEALKQAKIQTTLTMLQEQTNDATGNFSRELQTVAGKQAVASAEFKNAQVTIGTLLLPAFSMLASWLSTTATFLNENAGLVLTLGGTFVGLAAGIVGIVAVLKAWELWTQAVNIANVVLNTTMKANVVFLVVAAFAALVAGLMVAYDKIGWFKDGVDALWSRISAGAAVLGDILGNITDFVTEAWRILTTGGFDADSRKFLGIEEDHWFIGWLMSVRQAAIDMSTGVKAAFDTYVVPAWNGLMDVGEQVLSWYMDSYVPFMLDGWTKIGQGAMWLWREAVVPAWDGIRFVVGEVVTWFQTYVQPGLEKSVGALGGVFMAFWEEIIEPVFRWFRETVASWWGEAENTFSSAQTKIEDGLGPTLMAFWTDTVEPVFRLAGEAVAVWWVIVEDKLKAAEDFIRNVLAPTIKWWWDEVGGPIFVAAGEGISAWWTLAEEKLSTADDYLRNTLGPTIKWWWDEIGGPIFDSSKAAIDSWWTASKPILQDADDFFRNTLGPTLTWFKDDVVGPVFELAGEMISTAVTAVILPKLVDMNNFVRDTLIPSLALLGTVVGIDLPKSFKTGQAAIAIAWLLLKNAAMEPIRFIIDDVINGFLIPGFNKLARLFGTTEISPMPSPSDRPSSGGGGGGGRKIAMASGGTVPGHSQNSTADNIPIMATAREFMVRQPSAEALRRSNPGVLEYINQHGKLPERAEAAGHPGGGAALWGDSSFMRGARRAGAAYYTAVGPGMGQWQMPSAAAAWDRRFGIGVKYGMHPTIKAANAYGSMTTQGMGQFGYPVLAWAANNQIAYNPFGAGPTLSPAMKRAVSIHEMGHTLGLPHNEGYSIMNAMMNRGVMNPTGNDVANLRSIWGPYRGDNAAAPVPFSGGGGGFDEGWDPFSWIPKVGNPFDGVIDGLKTKFENTFSSEFAKTTFASASKLTGAGIEWAAGKIEEFTEVAKTLGEIVLRGRFPDLFDNGGMMGPNGGINRSGKPEPVLTAPQWNDMHQIAENTKNGGNGNIFEFTFNFNGTVYSEDDAKRLGKIAAAEIVRVVTVERRGGVYVGGQG